MSAKKSGIRLQRLRPRAKQHLSLEEASKKIAGLRDNGSLAQITLNNRVKTLSSISVFTDNSVSPYQKSPRVLQLRNAVNLQSTTDSRKLQANHFIKHKNISSHTRSLLPLSSLTKQSTTPDDLSIYSAKIELQRRQLSPLLVSPTNLPSPYAICTLQRRPTQQTKMKEKQKRKFKPTIATPKVDRYINNIQDDMTMKDKVLPDILTQQTEHKPSIPTIHNSTDKSMLVIPQITIRSATPTIQSGLIVPDIIIRLATPLPEMNLT